MKRYTTLLTGVLIALPAFAATLPSVSVTGVTATSPVLRSTASIGVSATVTPTFDSGSGPTSVTTTCKSNGGNNNCGTGNALVTDQTVITTTTVTVAKMTTTASAEDFNSTSPLTGSGTAFSGSLSTPLSGADGKITVTVTANVSEDVTTAVSTETINQTCTSSKGVTTCTTVSDTTVDSSNTVTKTGSGSNTGSYILDINPPTLVLDPDSGQQPTVQQGGDKNMHNHMEQGSAGSSYTLTDTVTAPDTVTTFSANGLGTFGPNGRAVDLVAVHLACDAPVGSYAMSATAATNDLGGNAFSPISYTSPETFNVVPGAALQNQTYIVSDTPDGYNTMGCFNATTSGKKISTNPGSFHLAALVNTTGRCAGIDSLSATVITLNLPLGFAFDVTGGSPAAHVFIVDAANGFDYHYPGPEISLPKTAITGANSSTLTVNLNGVSINGGLPGVIPGNVTIYVRAHITFNGAATNGGTNYLFTTNVNANLANVGLSSAAGSATLTNTLACTNGN
jgi:hypothetical protein